MARARGEVGNTPGITVIRPPRAAAAAVMPGVTITPGLPRGSDARGEGGPKGQIQPTAVEKDLNEALFSDHPRYLHSTVPGCVAKHFIGCIRGPTD